MSKTLTNNKSLHPCGWTEELSMPPPPVSWVKKVYIFPFYLSVLFVFILYLFQKSWSKGMSNLFLSCPAPKLLILASIKCNFLDVNFFCACLFVCLFIYFTLILKVRMMMMIVMMVMKHSLCLLFWWNVRWFTWLKSSIPLMNIIADSLIFNHFPSTLQKLYLWSTQVVLTLNNIKIEFSTQVWIVLTKIWRLVKCKVWCLRLVET